MTDQRQGSEGWHEQRKGLITGSVAGAILGLSPFMKSDDVMRQMVRDYFGAEREFIGNVATEYGQANELTAQLDFEEETGLTVNETGFHAKDNWLGASPDGLIDNDYVIEIKCPYGLRNESEPSFKSIDEQPHYFAQCQLEMLCTGRNKLYFYQWSKHGSKLEEIILDQKWLDENLPKLNSFYQAYLATIENEKEYKQYMEPKSIDMTDNQEWLKVESAYLFALEQQEIISNQVKELKEKLLAIADNHKCSTDRLTVFKTEKQGSIAYAKALKVIAPDADLEEYRGKPTSYWTVKVKVK